MSQVVVHNLPADAEDLACHEAQESGGVAARFQPQRLQYANCRANQQIGQQIGDHP
jgi:hypothetical protein